MSIAKRKFFIDWFEIFISNKVTDTKRLTLQECTWLTRSLPDPLRISNNRYTISTPWGTRISVKQEPRGFHFTWTGTSFLTKTIADDVHYLYSSYLAIIDPRFHVLTDINPISISRIDISYNVPTYALEDLDFIYDKRSTTYWFETEGQKTGVIIGKRGKDAVQLKAYLKSIDPGRSHALNRFGTVENIRVEYQIGHNVLKNLDIHHFRAGSDHNLKHNIKKILIPYLLNNKEIIIPHQTPVKKYKFKKTYSPTGWEHAYKSVESIILNHFTQEELSKLTKNMPNLLSQINDKT